MQLFISKNKKRKPHQLINEMNKIYFNRAFIYCSLLIALNIFGILLATLNNSGFKPYPSLFGLIFIPIIYSVFYWFLLSKLSSNKANILVFCTPSIFYLILIIINPFASWDLIYLLNELLNYLLCYIGYFTEGKIISNTKINDILLYIIFPIIYQVIIIAVLKIIRNRK